ncbi:JAB domain-containing protein [Nitrosomonas sp. HPC101]|uniref:RadC family protein n=1 Tax=Nitrosomonas sp. HPC101 TaxID=1658667 RepID=UPI00136DDC99|nr:DNA repair protein RadC [Nitrosomonas sp. HPC101]MXS84588.1 JAB domain-containing protein [Nitrosomonas sp. HPC101]
MAISDWPEAERPREKLIIKGAAALSDAELLAIFLRTGITGISAVELARKLLTHFGSLTKLCAANLHEFSELPGMGPAKFAQLQAVMEMARRALAEELKSGDIMNSPQSVRSYLRLSLSGRPHEVFVGIFLDARHRTIVTEELFNGTLTQASVYPREVVKRALYHNAAAMIFAHNHPSGIAEPSKADETLTQSLKQALALVDVKVLDHFVIGGSEVVSFAERGLI